MRGDEKIDSDNKTAALRPSAAPVSEPSQIPRWRLLPDEPWMERSATGEYIKWSDHVKASRPGGEST